MQRAHNWSMEYARAEGGVYNRGLEREELKLKEWIVSKHSVIAILEEPLVAASINAWWDKNGAGKDAGDKNAKFLEYFDYPVLTETQVSCKWVWILCACSKWNWERATIPRRRIGESSSPDTLVWLTYLYPVF